MSYIATILVGVFFGIYMGFSYPNIFITPTKHLPTIVPKPTVRLSTLITYGPEYFENEIIKRINESTPSARLSKYQEIISEKRQGKIVLPVVMYHYIEKYVDSQDTIKQKLTVMLPEFEYQLSSWKKANYETIFARDLSLHLSNGDIVDGRYVTLTFDDGYEDFYLYVFPLLKKYNAKATVYVISGYIGRQGFLTSKQIRELEDSGLVEIGGHTVDHTYLKSLDKINLLHEVKNDKETLEQILSKKLMTFAYPFGAYSLDAEVATINAGYSASFTTEPGIVHENTKTSLLKRIRPHQINYNDIDGSLMKIYNQYK